MKIYFGKYAGKSVIDLPSGYLVWILESYENCDQPLRVACQAELSDRLKLDFTSQTEVELTKIKHDIDTLKTESSLLKDAIAISKGNSIILEGYLQNPDMLQDDLDLIARLNGPEDTSQLEALKTKYPHLSQAIDHLYA